MTLLEELAMVLIDHGALVRVEVSTGSGSDRVQSATIALGWRADLVATGPRYRLHYEEDSLDYSYQPGKSMS